MENKDNGIRCVAAYGGFNGDSDRSLALNLELLSLLELPLKQHSFKKSSLQLIARQLAAKVSMLQQKTEAGIRTLELTQAPEHATMACFFVPAYQWWLRQGTFTVAGSFGSGCSNPVWATTTEIRTSCGSDFNPKRLPA